jgi:hypothetical protein
MLLLYAKQVTPRLKYTAKFIFQDILQTEVHLTSSVSEVEAFSGPVLNYSDQELPGVKLHPRALLFKSEITRIDVDAFDYKGIPAIMSVSKPSALPFDPLAATFYMISRYEEYGPHKTDRYGRFSSSASVAYRQGFLEIPVVDHWAYFLRDEIEKAYPLFRFPKRTYKFLPTIDIDMAWSYRHKGFWRAAGAFVRSALRRDFDEIRQRYRVLFKDQQDPYDTFDLLQGWHKEMQLSPVMFFQIGPYGKYDKNISIKCEEMQQLIRDVQKYCHIGVHPSYQSNKSYDNLYSEVLLLSSVTREKITRSRQHFLMLQLPDTYHSLISSGIREDYTMGHAAHAGFRAGTCTPFRFFDLISNSETPLIIYPFAVMDVTLKNYIKLTPSEAVPYVNRLINEVKKVDGLFCSLWHNESLCEVGNWKGWRQVYYELLKLAR